MAAIEPSIEEEQLIEEIKEEEDKFVKDEEKEQKKELLNESENEFKEEKQVNKEEIQKEINDNEDIEKNLEDNNEKENILEKDLSMDIGTYEDAPDFIQDNEYIKTGYILHCNTFKKTFKSLFMWHNETINIWSHLLGALFFFALIFYTEIFITNFKTQLTNIRKDLSLMEEKVELLHNQSPNITDEMYNSVKDIKVSFKEFNEKIIYQESIDKIVSLYNEIKNFSMNSIDYISHAFSDIFSSFKEGILSLKEQIMDLIKLDNSKNSQIETNLDNDYDLNLKDRQVKSLARWPLFIIILSAIICLTFSASFHSIGNMNEKYHILLNRFDYGGISILISGSCYPPYYYFFYYSTGFRYFYLTEISVFGIGTFLYSLTDDFNKPERRTLRGILFLIFGLCTGIPILHMSFFGDKIEGYGSGIKLINWYFGGISYIVGALLYILRFPEKIFPKKFDYIGASHQIFHVLVFLGATFHFFGSLDAYNYRFKNLILDSVE